MSGEEPPQRLKIKIQFPPRMSNPPDKSTSTLSPRGQTTSDPPAPKNTISTTPPPGKSSFTPSPSSPGSTSAQHGPSAPGPADTSSASPDTPRRKTAPPQRSNSPTHVPVGPGPGAGTEPVSQTERIPERTSVPSHRQTHKGISNCYVGDGGCRLGWHKSTYAERKEEAAPASDGGDPPVSLSPVEQLVATEIWKYNQSVSNSRKRSESPSEEE
ncbi:hypothetical protein BJ166DRAFT_606717 [Pestalotiopsis sp. NC0098]|nr:hypothetical protein BJ166DRAFT_606717 [Pestalotiopsis sp. NC0098]